MTLTGIDLHGCGIQQCAELTLFTFVFLSSMDQLAFVDEQFLHLSIEIRLLVFQFQRIEEQRLRE